MRRGNQHESVDAAWVIDCQSLGNHAAEGKPKDMSPIDLKIIQ